VARSDRIAKGVTRVAERRNITTGKQMNLRLTGLDDDALSILVEKIQERLPNKNITRSRVVRAACYIEDDKLIDNLAQLLVENT
jgi:acyl-homoserine lactone acylase PvdQ